MNEEILPADPNRGRREIPLHEVPVVGEFRQGSDVSQIALRRYLLTRALGSSVVSTLQWTGVAVLVLAVLCWAGGVKWLAVLIGLVALVILGIRSLVAGLGRRLSGADQLGPLEPQVSKMVGRTRRGLRAELHRVGLPHSPWAPLLIAFRLIRPLRRVPTMQALTRIDLTKVVPASQVDELHLLLARGAA